MRKIFLLLSLVIFITATQASVISNETDTKKTKEQKKQEQLMAMRVLSKMSVAEYETMRGKKLTALEKVAFKSARKQAQMKVKSFDNGGGFNVGGFLLGFLLGILGVLIAYIFSKDSNLHKWTWIGFGIWVGLVLIFALLL